MYEVELEAAIAAAMEAGILVLDIYAGDFVAEEKIGADKFSEPVTEADRSASKLITERLADVFPDDAMLSEEEPDDAAKRLAHERVWIIDPIDGTAGFIKRDGDFAIQIGLAECGRAVVGVVYLPAHRVLYFASKGGGAFRRRAGADERLETSDTTDLTEMTMAVSRNHRSSKMDALRTELGLRGEITRGSVGLKMGLIAEQACDLYIHLSPRTKLWDACAPQIILEEAGGCVTDLFGDEFRYDRGDVQNHGGICATNGAVHKTIMDKLDPLLKKFGRVKQTTSKISS